MFLEIFLVGRPFFRLHRYWLSVFFGLEVLFLFIAFGGLFLVHQSWFTECNHLNLVLFFVVPAFLLQITLALQLGLTFNLKSPAAWTMRLPYSEHAPSLFSYMLIWGNAFILFGALFLAWVLFYEWTAFPIALPLILFPSLAFQIVRRVRNPTAGIAAAVATIAVILLISIITLLYIASNHGIIDVQQNTFFLGTSFLAALLADPCRKRFFKLSLIIIFVFSVSLGAEVYREIIYQQTDYYRHVKEIEARVNSQKLKCDQFREAASKISYDRNVEELKFSNPLQIFHALEVLKIYPYRFVSRHELTQLWLDLTNQPLLIITLWGSLLQTNIGCSVVEWAELLKPMIAGISQDPDLEPHERRLLADEVWKAISQQVTASSATLVEATVILNLIKEMSEKQLIEGISIEKLNILSSHLDKIGEKTHHLHLYKWILQLLAPTNDRSRNVLKAIYINEIKPVSDIIDQLVELESKAKLRQF